MMLTIGLKGKFETVVGPENTAAAAGTGTLQVFGTPFMMGWMEKAAAESVHPLLPETETTVGTLLNVVHTAATPVGMSVRIESELTEVDGRRLTFKVTAFDEVGPIGEGIHERFIVRVEPFLAKCAAKLKKD